MLFDAGVHGIHQVMVDHENHLAQRHVRRPEHGHGHRSYQQCRGQNSKDPLRNHMNSFSFVRSV